MYFSLLNLIFILFLWSSPDQTIKVNRLTIITAAVPEDANFYWTDLEEVESHSETESLVLKMVTCPLSHTKHPTGDRMTMLDGYQHVAVIALNNSGEVVADAKAALPCPPHCGGGKLETTLAAFLSSH